MEALADLKQRGYTVDLNLVFGWLRPEMPFSLSPDRFQITGRYRFEGEQPAGGDAVVYAIESTNGFKEYSLPFFMFPPVHTIMNL